MKLSAPKLSTARLCGAKRSRDRGPCCARAMKGRLRCYAHGGGSTGPATAEGKAKSLAARIEGRRRWVEQMRQAKAAGLIDRFPGGRPPEGRFKSRPGEDKVVRQARLALDGAANMPKPPASPIPAPPVAPMVPVFSAAAPAPVAKPWEAQGHGEKLDELTTSALGTLKDILDQPTALNDPKMLSIQKDTALSVISAKIRVEAGKMQQEDRVSNLNRLLACLKAGELPTFLDENRSA